MPEQGRFLLMIRSGRPLLPSATENAARALMFMPRTTAIFVERGGFVGSARLSCSSDLVFVFSVQPLLHYNAKDFNYSFRATSWCTCCSHSIFRRISTPFESSSHSSFFTEFLVDSCTAVFPTCGCSAEEDGFEHKCCLSLVSMVGTEQGAMASGAVNRGLLWRGRHVRTDGVLEHFLIRATAY